tara:strand:- start:3152 stop:4306 length:1155 start_codon:yes stop_codon:yes gene_type:complete
MADLLSEYMESSMPKDKVMDTIEDYFKTEIANKVIKFDYDNMKTGNKISLFVDEKWKYRVDVQQILLNDLFKNISKRATTGGSTGSVRVGQDSPQRYVPIFLRPAGRASGGINNEKIFMNRINDFVKNLPDGLAIEFITNNKSPTWTRQKFRVENVIECEGVGQKGTPTSANPRVKKSDADLIIKGGGRVPISIKQDNADFWGGMESWFHTSPNIKNGDDYVSQAEALGIVRIVPITQGINHLAPGKNTKNTPGGTKDKKNMSLLANDMIKDIVVFGNDIHKGGAIIKKTFNSDDFVLKDRDNGEQVLEINCDGIVTNLKELNEHVWVMFQNTGDLSVKGDVIGTPRGKNSKVAPGVRAIAVTGKRAKTTILIKDTAFGSIVQI